MVVGSETAGSALRCSRAFALAAVALVTGVTAHVGAGGQVPAVEALAVLLVIVAGAVGPMLGHPASTRRVVLLLACGETFIHYALLSISVPLGQTGTGPTPGTASMTGPMAGMLHDQTVAPTLHQHAAMAAAHLAAAVAVGLWLAAGEHALWALLRVTVQPVTSAVARLLNTDRRLSPVPGCERISAAAADRERCAPCLSARACRVVTRRGPPSVSSLPLLGI